MDEAVKQGKVEKCAQLLFYVAVAADCHKTTVKRIVNEALIDAMQ